MTERHCLRTELRENLYRPLWGSKKQSSSTLDGVVRCFPSEAPVGPLTRPSGLSRAQQLIIFDTLKIFFLPSFCSHHGGLAFDRAFPLFGSSHLWSTLLLRVKAQKCVQNGGPNISDKLKNVGSWDNYCLSLKTRARFGSKSSLEASMGTDNLANLKNLFRNPASAEEGTAVGRWDGIGGRVDFTHKYDLYKLLVSCAFRERFQTHGSALFLPAVISTEVISNDLHYPFHFRIGLHQILDVFPNAQDVNHDCANAVYFQGGFGIDGVATLLKSSKVHKRKEEKLEKMRESTEFRPGFIRFLPISHKKRLLSKQDTIDSKASQFPSSTSVLKSLRQQIATLRKASDQISTATKLVEEGKLKTLASKDTFFDNGTRGKKIFLPSPHLKIGGLLGVVSSFGFHKDGLDRMNLPESGYVSPALVRRRANLRWKSTLDETPVKVFVGCSISAQLGRMKRQILSFTSAIAQFECTIPISIGQTSLPRRIQTIASSQRNLMLGNIPLRPLVNFSVVQQAIGPVRLKADCRVALESTSAVTSMANLTLGNALLQQVQSIKPCVVDTQFGFDFVVPGTQGAIKFGGWFSPSRKEAMAEMRMF